MAHSAMLYETHLVQCIAVSSSAPAAHESGSGVTQQNYHIGAEYGEVNYTVPLVGPAIGYRAS